MARATTEQSNSYQISLSPFFAAAIIDGMRLGRELSVIDGENLNQADAMKLLRPLITADDVSWLLPHIGQYEDQRVGVYIGLLANHASRDEVRKALQGAWKHASPFLKSHLMWRLLDDSGLPVEWHERLLEYVLDEWDTFWSGTVRYLGPAHELVLARALERFCSDEFTATKRWIYLCSAAGAAQYPAAVRAMLQLASRSDDPFTQRVAQALADSTLSRFG